MISAKFTTSNFNQTYYRQLQQYLLQEFPDKLITDNFNKTYYRQLQLNVLQTTSAKTYYRQFQPNLLRKI